MSIPPTSILQHRSNRFRPDGGIPLVGLIMTVVLCWGSALLIGGLVSVIHQWFYLMVLFPLLMGLGVGFAGAYAIEHGKVRNPMFVCILGFSGGALVMVASYFGSYVIVLLSLINQFGAQAPMPSFFEFMDFVAQQGVTIGRMGRGQDKGTNLGYIGSYIYWGAETLLAAGIAYSMMREPVRAPFCLGCRRWKPGSVLGVAILPKENAKDIMDAGDMPRLLQIVPEEKLPVPANPVMFTAFACPECAERETVEVNLKEHTVNKKGEEKFTNIGTWSFGGEALPCWQRLFIERQQV